MLFRSCVLNTMITSSVEQLAFTPVIYVAAVELASLSHTGWGFYMFCLPPRLYIAMVTETWHELVLRQVKERRGEKERRGGGEERKYELSMCG